MSRGLDGTAAAEQSTCVVLMFKAPARSKRRLAREIGELASVAAARLFECALEDLRSWPGPICFAPAEPADADWLAERLRADDPIVPQGRGNLGERINAVNRALWQRGLRRQILIGIDCPSLTGEHLAQAARALDDYDAALAPAVDGGVVLMASRRLWPPLRDLPWSEPALLDALVEATGAAGWRVHLSGALTDVDTSADLESLGPALEGDGRPARRALNEWLGRHRRRLGHART